VNEWMQVIAECVEAAFERLPPKPTAPIRAVVAEPAVQDARRLQSDVADELEDRVLTTVDEIRAAFCVLLGGKAVADSEDSATDAIARFDDSDARAGRFKNSRRRETCQSGAGDKDMWCGCRSGTRAHTKRLPTFDELQLPRAVQVILQHR